jgi:hypothetical protein
VADGEGRAISTTMAARPSVLVIWLMRRDRRYGGMTGICETKQKAGGRAGLRLTTA